jgi:hypothetical protein
VMREPFQTYTAGAKHDMHSVFESVQAHGRHYAPVQPITALHA